jgi:hypothetical protein
MVRQVSDCTKLALPGSGANIRQAPTRPVAAYRFQAISTAFQIVGTAWP